MYKSIEIANYFLSKDPDGIQKLTPMKIIKLVYLAHAWHLALSSQPLLNERIVAWKYGPVIRSLYDEFKRFGNKTIAQTCAQENNAFISPDTEKLLDKIWEVYGKFTAAQLSNLTHQEGSPWYKAWIEQEGSTKHDYPIDDEIIKEHYERKAGLK